MIRPFLQRRPQTSRSYLHWSSPDRVTFRVSSPHVPTISIPKQSGMACFQGAAPILFVYICVGWSHDVVPLRIFAHVIWLILIWRSWKWSHIVAESLFISSFMLGDLPLVLIYVAIKRQWARMHRPYLGLVVRNWHIFEEMHLCGIAISVPKQSEIVCFWEIGPILLDHNNVRRSHDWSGVGAWCPGCTSISISKGSMIGVQLRFYVHIPRPNSIWHSQKRSIILAIDLYKSAISVPNHSQNIVCFERFNNIRQISKSQGWGKVKVRKSN